MWNPWRKASAQIETKATLAAPDAALLAQFGQIGQAGTFAVSPAEAIKVPAVSAAIRTISEAASILHRRVVVAGPDGQTKIDHQHPVGALLRGDVNAWTSGSEFIRDLIAQALTSDGGGVATVTRVRGKTIEIIQPRPGFVKVEIEDATGETKFFANGQEIDRADVIHVRSNFDRCPLTLAAEAIGVARAMERHAGNLFARGAKPGGVIEFPQGVKLANDALERVKAAWNAAHSGANSGGTAILWDGATFKAMTLTSVDAQFLELRKFQNHEIARAFRVPPSMIYEMDRATWSNSQQMGREFLVYSLEPWLQISEAALTRALFSDAERKRGYRIMFDRDDLTRADIGERATAYSQLVAARIFNPNEIRDWENAAPYTGGDEFTNPHITTQPPKATNNG